MEGTARRRNTSGHVVVCLRTGAVELSRSSQEGSVKRCDAQVRGGAWVVSGGAWVAGMES